MSAKIITTTQMVGPEWHPLFTLRVQKDCLSCNVGQAISSEKSVQLWTMGCTNVPNFAFCSKFNNDWKT